MDADQAERLIRRWAQQVGADAATLDAALAYTFAPPEPEPDRESEVEPQPDAQPQPQREAPAGDLAAQLAALATRVQQAQPRTYTPPPAWQPEREPLLAGMVMLVEALDRPKGPVRVIVARRGDGEMRTVWCSAVHLAGGLREIELQHGRALRPSDLLALHYRGSDRTGNARYPAKQFAIEAEFTA